MRNNRLRHLLLLFLGLAWVALPATPARAQCPDPLPAPYVFLLLDTSGSMNYGAVCTQTQIDAGQCSYLCPTGDCFVPLQGDDPASKFRQLKEGLQSFLATETNAQLGFATYNQDQLRVAYKHWMYQAQNGGPSISGFGPFPAIGASEVFGFNWGCDTGSNDNEIGCYATKPANLSNTWELTRVQRLPKGGPNFNQAVTFYIKQGTLFYKATYTPAAGSLPGASAVNVTVRIDRCTNSTCSTTVLQGQTTVHFVKASEFVSWDAADSTNTLRTDPEMSFYGPQAMDAFAANSCAGWDPNNDSSSDPYNGYNLRFPTDSSDPRGSSFTVGDVLPPDWTNDHNLDIQVRLAPNLAANPLATPDASISPYLRDTRTGFDLFLRLKDETQRPLIASGATPILYSLQSFRSWYPNWRNVALAQDPLFSCRKQAVVLLVDAVETCSTSSTCTAANDLRFLYGVQTYVIGFGDLASSASTVVSCIAAEGGTTSPLFPATKSDLNTTLSNIFTALQNP